MARYSVEISSQGQTTYIRLKEPFLFGVPSWECTEGVAVWGNPASGDCLSPNLSGGSIELNLGSVISDWEARVGADGSGYRLEDNGGSFPTGDFDWTCVSKD